MYMDKRKNPIKELLPFWLYFLALLIGTVLFFMYPLIFLVLLPFMIMGVFTWAVVVYLVAGAVQNRTNLKKIRERMLLSFFCSVLVRMIFPVSQLVYDFIQEKQLDWENFLYNFTNRVLFIGFVIHFLAFWIGEEIETL